MLGVKAFSGQFVTGGSIISQRETASSRQERASP
jgi:ribosomal protein L27